MRHLLILFPVTFVAAFLCYCIAWNPTNHSSFDFLNFIYPLSVCAVITACIYIVKRKRFFLAALMVNIFGIAFFYCVDFFNIMVEHRRWGGRGMPDSFTIARRVVVPLSEELRLQYVEIELQEIDEKLRENEKNIDSDFHIKLVLMNRVDYLQRKDDFLQKKEAYLRKEKGVLSDEEIEYFSRQKEDLSRKIEEFQELKKSLGIPESEFPFPPEPMEPGDTSSSTDTEYIIRRVR